MSVPVSVVNAFADRAALPLPELAKVVGMDVKTLRKHIAAERLPVHIKGTGLVRRHYVCTLDDVTEFYRRTGDACQSLGSEIPRSINSTSKSKVYAFPALRSAGMNVTRRISRARNAKKPRGLSKTQQAENEHL